MRQHSYNYLFSSEEIVSSNGLLFYEVNIYLFIIKIMSLLTTLFIFVQGNFFNSS